MILIISLKVNWSDNVDNWSQPEFGILDNLYIATVHLIFNFNWSTVETERMWRWKVFFIIMVNCDPTDCKFFLRFRKHNSISFLRWSVSLLYLQLSWFYILVNSNLHSLANSQFIIQTLNYLRSIRATRIYWVDWNLIIRHFYKIITSKWYQDQKRN